MQSLQKSLWNFSCQVVDNQANLQRLLSERSLQPEMDCDNRKTSSTYSFLPVGALPSTRDGLRLSTISPFSRASSSRSAPFNQRWIATHQLSLPKQNDN